MEFADRGWNPGMLFGRKRFRRIADDYSELYIEETGDWEETEKNFQVKYREGRLGPSDKLEYGEFDELENAVEYAELILNGEADIEELR